MDYLAVAIAGFLGAAARAWLGTLAAERLVTPFPVSTLLINYSGSLFLSFFLTFTLDRSIVSPRLRLAIGTGFLGAYTTFSTFTLESLNLFRSGAAAYSIAYITATAAGCVLLSWLGVDLGRRLTRGDEKTSEKQSADTNP